MLSYTLQLVDDTFAILLMMFFLAYCLLGHWTFYMSCNFLNWTLPLQTAFLTRQNFTACKYFKTKTWHEDFFLQIRPSVTWTTNLKQQDFDEFGVPDTCFQLKLKWVLEFENPFRLASWARFLHLPLCSVAISRGWCEVVAASTALTPPTDDSNKHKFGFLSRNFVC